MSRHEYDTLHKLSEVHLKTLAALLGSSSACCLPKNSCDPCPNGADALYDLARLQLSFYERMLGLAAGGGCGCPKVTCCEQPKCKCGCSSKVPADPKVPGDCCGPSDSLAPAPTTCLQLVVTDNGTARAKFVLRNDNASTVEIDLAVSDFVRRDDTTDVQKGTIKYLDANGDEVTSPVCLVAFQCIELWIEVTVGDWEDCKHYDAKLTAKGCGVCHELCLDLYVTDGCAPEFVPKPEPKPEPDPCVEVSPALQKAIEETVTKAIQAALANLQGPV